MTGFNHVLTGITIAVVVRQPVLAPLLAFVLHFVLDSIPHFGDEEYTPWTKKLIRLLIIDGVLCFTFLGLAIWLFPDLWGVVTLCAFTATLPDFLWIAHYKYGLTHWFFTFHKKIQWGERPWGMYVEIPYMIVLCILLGFLALTY